MSSDFLNDRRKSLEEEFFHKESQRDLAKMKEKLAQKTSKEELKKASGMEDDAVLDKLMELGIGAETITALSLVPLIKVAWADGAIQSGERDAILQGALGKGIEKDSASFELLDEWLAQEPPKSLFDAWAAYINTLKSELTNEQTSVLKTQVTRFAQVIAEAAGGFLGIGKVAKEEKRAIEWIESIFDGQPDDGADGDGASSDE